MNHRSRSVVLVGGAVIGLLAIGLLYIQKSAGGTSDLVLYGNVDVRDLNVAFRVGGRLARLNVDEGAAVKRGDVLGNLDMEEFRNSLSMAEATLAAREAALVEAELQLKRQQKLVSTGASPQRLLDSAISLRDQLKSQVKGDTAALANARLQLSDAVLRSPADGVIMTRAVEPGTMLEAGSTVFTLALIRPVWVRAYVGETDLGRAVPGAAVTVISDTRPTRPYHGTIGFVSPTAEFTPKTVETADLRTALVYRLRVVVTDPDDWLRQGMPVTVRIAGQ